MRPKGSARGEAFSEEIHVMQSRDDRLVHPS